jgi:nitroimidazol reductase NimA-like FMN-containing flavoprotein (pyridoxamine 5'-phosphate oxidase superfamily)
MTAESPQDRARLLIERNTLMAVATTSNDARPWVSPVFYAIDKESQLYWVSDVDARHSANVRNNGAVSIVIHDQRSAGKVDAVYIQAEAEELTDESDVRLGMDVMAGPDQDPKWKIDAISNVTGDGPWRIYRARRTSTEVRKEWIKGGKCVVGREPADF